MKCVLLYHAFTSCWNNGNAHFLRGYGRWQGRAQVCPELRKMVEFRRINLVAPDWLVDQQFDAIFCRNVIIYFDHQTQERILRRLAGCLKPGGYLFCGHSENLFWLRDLLATVEPTVYCLKPGVSV